MASRSLHHVPLGRLYGWAVAFLMLAGCHCAPAFYATERPTITVEILNETWDYVRFDIYSGTRKIRTVRVDGPNGTAFVALGQINHPIYVVARPLSRSQQMVSWEQYAVPGDTVSVRLLPSMLFTVSVREK